MGVLGLTPFLQKTCPEVIRKLPDRLRSLRGKTIVIDGTLITQRFHFAPIPLQHRHVLGWHRMVTELKECGVKAICVFDGKERNAAKAREVERRREVRKLDAARGSIEVERLDRLRKLARLLLQCRALEARDRDRVTQTLRNISSSRYLSAQPADGIWQAPPAPEQMFSGHEIPWPASKEPPSGKGMGATSSLPINSELFASHHGSNWEDNLSSSSFDLFDISQSDIRDILLSRIGQVVSVPHEVQEPYDISYQDCNRMPEIAERKVSEEHPDVFRGLDKSSPVLVSEEPNNAMSQLNSIAGPSYDMSSASDIEIIVAEDILCALSSLYIDYRRSIARVTSLPSPLYSQQTSESIEDAAEARLEYAMSKSQFQLTLDEGKVWDELVDPPGLSEDATGAAEISLALLAEKSSIISESYERRTHPPSLQTYQECREIIRAMGIPCIESTGPFEAEALASSLVINGFADYVASEDTDVLIYEAPLIRNIANREGPLIVVSGSDVRSVLQLERSSYIDFALLLGTDFSQRIKNVGPQRALKFIREHGSIERVLEQEIKYPPRMPLPIYLRQVELARTVFQTLPPVPNPDLLQTVAGDTTEVFEIMQRYNLQRHITNYWDYQAALAGNYFGDNPTA